MLYFAYPVTGLSHCLAKDKQLDSPRRDILKLPYWNGQSAIHPKWTFRLRYLLGFWICEIQWPKITFVNVLFPLRFDPPTLPGYLSRLQKYKKVSTLCVFLRKIFIIRCKFQEKALFLQKISIESWGLCWSIWRYGKKGKQRLREKESSILDLPRWKRNSSS